MPGCLSLIVAILILSISYLPALSQNAQFRWQRLPGAAVDLSISHAGHMWSIGTDGHAYRWDASRKAWQRYGQERNLSRIDAGADGSAFAVTSEFQLLYTNGRGGRWVDAGFRVRDVGVGGGWVWVVRTDSASGGGQVWRAPDEGIGDFNWVKVDGGLLHIDVDPGGNAWGVDDRNDVQQFDGRGWRRHSVKATDIGVGGDNSVWIVGDDYVEARGGGSLFVRRGGGGNWQRDAGRRLRTITAGPGGNPAGVDNDGRIWDKSEPVQPGTGAGAGAR